MHNEADYILTDLHWEHGSQNIQFWETPYGWKYNLGRPLYKVVDKTVNSSDQSFNGNRWWLIEKVFRDDITYPSLMLKLALQLNQYVSR